MPPIPPIFFGEKMPYIKPELRNLVDPEIQVLKNRIELLGEDKMDGTLNYVITNLLFSLYRDLSYSNINKAIGVLECAKLELYRKVGAPYEDRKEKENGPVY